MPAGMTAAMQRKHDRANIHLPQTATVGMEDISRGITTPKQRSSTCLVAGLRRSKPCVTRQAEPGQVT